jgi:hypothetical protein
MERRKSPVEVAYPVPPEFVACIQAWQTDAVTILMEYLWQGILALTSELSIDLAEDLENLERGLNQLLPQRVRDVMSDKAPFYFEHHPFEDEGRSARPAVPKAPDFAFILRANPRASLPVEAKVLESDTAVTEYVNEINGNCLECRYAPFSSHGAMLGYLRRGSVDKVIESIGEVLNCKLALSPALSACKHHTSEHKRTSVRCSGYPRDFTCHHLIAVFVASQKPGQERH